MPKKAPEDKNRAKTYSLPPGLDEALEELGIRMGGVNKSVLAQRAFRNFLKDAEEGSPRVMADPEDRWTKPEGKK